MRVSSGDQAYTSDQNNVECRLISRLVSPCEQLTLVANPLGEETGVDAPDGRDALLFQPVPQRGLRLPVGVVVRVVLGGVANIDAARRCVGENKSSDLPKHLNGRESTLQLLL